MKVRNMHSRSGRKVPNQFIITDRGFEYFQSYDTTIARRRIKTGEVALDNEMWDYSATTGRYRNQFLNEGIETTRQKIESGVHTLTNLNK